jgi:hypothetical protein
MPLVHSKPVRVIKKTAPASFFTLKARSSGRNTNRPDYATFERQEAMPQNPSRSNTAFILTLISANESPANTIEVTQPRDTNYDSDKNIEEPLKLTFANITLTKAEKIKAIKK